jgi:GPH family glycoside/pentoside/hexuronide:cation symporter
MENTKPVGRNTILSYGGLATPLAMIGYPIAIWLIPFYSEVVKIDLVVIANILLLARFTDVITDPILGQLGDSTRTAIGRRKPWIILGVPLMMLAIYKLFIPGTEVTIVYFVLWMMMMYLGSTIIGIPYGAWGAEISEDYHQRSRIVSGREGWTLIGLLISALIPLAIEVSSEEMATGESVSRMFQAVFLFQDFSSSGKMRDILAYMGMGIIMLLPIFAAIAIWKVPDPMPKVKKKIPLREGLKFAAENPLLVRILLIIFLVIAGESFRNTLSLWFVRDIIGIETIGASYARYFIAGFITIPFWLWLGKTIGKHRAFCITLVGTGSVSFMCFFLEYGDLKAFHVLFLLKGACFGGLQFLPASMLADVVDLDSLKTGGRRAGTFFALNGMIAKVSSMVAVWAAAVLISAFGFTPGIENSESAVLALRVLYCLGCAAFFLPALYLTWTYPLTKEKHEELRRELEAQTN